jgi:hypothetical protein
MKLWALNPMLSFVAGSYVYTYQGSLQPWTRRYVKDNLKTWTTHLQATPLEWIVPGNSCQRLVSWNKTSESCKFNQNSWTWEYTHCSVKVFISSWEPHYQPNSTWHPLVHLYLTLGGNNLLATAHTSSSRLLTGTSLRLLRCSNIHISFEQSALTLCLVMMMDLQSWEAPIQQEAS